MFLTLLETGDRLLLLRLFKIVKRLCRVVGLSWNVESRWGLLVSVGGEGLVVRRVVGERLLGHAVVDV